MGHSGISEGKSKLRTRSPERIDNVPTPGFNEISKSFVPFRPCIYFSELKVKITKQILK
jgi:hypothetical protein